MTEVNDASEDDTKPETERTVTITGIPILGAGVVGFILYRLIRRRFGASAP